MKQENKNMVFKAKKAINDWFSKISFLKVSEPKAGTKYSYADFIMKTRIGDKTWNLACYAAGNGQPLNIRRAADQLFRYKQHCKDVYGIFIAPFISDKGAEICAEEGMGYVDFSGNARIVFGNVYLEQRGKPNKFLVKRDLQGLYSPKAERVLRTLLNAPEKEWTVKALSVEAGVSIGLASNIKKLLFEREWLKVLENGIKLSSPYALLKEWSASYDYRKNDIRQFYSLAAVPETEALIASVCKANKIRYAFTGFSGAARMAPMVTYNRVMVYAGEGFEEIFSLCNLKKVETGANVMVYYPYDDGIFYGMKDIDDTKVVSAVQLYLDLAGYKGRGEEAAQAILERVLKFNVE